MFKFTQFKKLLLFLLMIITGSLFAQTGVKITYYDTSTQTFNVENTGKLYFSGDNLMVQLNDTSSATSIPVSIIQKINFVAAALGTGEIGENSKNLQLYPNPSTDFIRIKSQNSEKLSVAIYSLSGKIALKGIYSSEENINVSKLTAGVYLVQVNGVTIKFIKK